MRKELLFFYFVFLFLFLGCSQKSDFYDMHTSEISLDWAGVYKGALRDKNLGLVDATLELDYNLNFILTRKQEGKASQTSGVFHWLEGGNKIKIEETVCFHVAEGYLEAIDCHGSRVAEDNAIRLHKIN